MQSIGNLSYRKESENITQAEGQRGVYSLIVEMLNMVMMSRAKKKRAHLVELNEPVLKDEEKNEDDMAK